MSSNLKVNTILPSTGTTIGIGTVGGLINVVGNIDVNSTSGISTFNGLEISGIVTAKAGAAVTYYGDGSNLTNLDASDLASGTVPTARLGSGTASSSTFLRGDSTFAAVTSTTINNNGDNKVITGSGTADTLNAEGNVYIDAQGDLGLGISDITPTAASYNGATLQLHQTTSGSYGAQIKMTTASGGYGANDGFYLAHWGGNNGTFFYNKENAPLYFGTNGTERATIDEHLTITDGNLVIGTAGHGIDFSATGDGSGSMSSEILDDYEEGSFTPFFRGAGSAGSYGYSRQVGKYTKIGQRVFFNLYLTLNAISANASGNLMIYGLPYTSEGGNAYSFAGVAYYYGFNGITPQSGLIDISNTRLYLYQNNATSEIVNSTAAGALTTTSSIIMGGQYSVG